MASTLWSVRVCKRCNIKQNPGMLTVHIMHIKACESHSNLFWTLEKFKYLSFVYVEFTLNII